MRKKRMYFVYILLDSNYNYLSNQKKRSSGRLKKIKSGLTSETLQPQHIVADHASIDNLVAPRSATFHIYSKGNQKGKVTCYGRERVYTNQPFRTVIYF